MAELQKISRGVVVEFDFTAIDGAQLLFDTAKAYLSGIGINLDVKAEALYLAGGNMQGAMKELFKATGNKHDPVKASLELNAQFIAALTAKLADGVTDGFKAFVKALAAKDVKVVVASRVGIEDLTAALGGLVGANVVPFTELSTTYGGCKWDAWRRAAHQNALHEMVSAAVVGSGLSVKAAMVAGFSAAAVIHPHTAYQDFGGADVAVSKIDAALAKEVLAMLHLA